MRLQFIIGKVVRMKQLKRIVIFVLLLTLCIPVSVEAKTVKMPNKLYKQVKGKWYTQNSSNGYDVKFSKAKIKFYRQGSNKVEYSAKLLKVKKIKTGDYKGMYRLTYKGKSGKFQYVGNKKGFDYFWYENGERLYSASSSLTPGRGPLS